MMNDKNIPIPLSLTTSQKQILLHNLFKEKLKKSLFEFYKEFCKVLEPSTNWNFNWHHEYLCSVLQKEIFRIKNNEPRTKHLIINVPPRTSKSLLLLAAQAWSWLHTDLAWISISYSSGLSNDHSNKIFEFLNSPFVARFFKKEYELTMDHQSKTDFKLKKGGSRISSGLTGAILGRGANIIVLDDPQSPDNLTQLGIHSTIRSFTDTVSTRLNNPKVDMYVLVQQRLHSMDLTGYLLSEQPEQWYHVCLPSSSSERISPSFLKEYYKNGLLWSEWLTEEILAEKKLNIGSQGYANQFLQSPVAVEGNIVKNAWIKIMAETDFYKLIYDVKKTKAKWDIYLDSAQTMSSKNDPSGILIGCQIDNIFYVKKFINEYLEFPDLIRKLQDVINLTQIENPSTRLFVEPKSNGKDVIAYLRKNTMFNVVELKAPATDKMSRLKAVSPLIESGRLVLLEHTSNSEVMEQLCGFPNVTHDEACDLIGYLLTNNGGRGSGKYNLIL